jgi:hypothetical protein
LPFVASSNGYDSNTNLPNGIVDNILHSLTVDGAEKVNSATLKVPPSASIIFDGVMFPPKERLQGYSV